MASDSELTISIVSYNTKEFLRECLNSIEAASIKSSYEVWVVDNASSDGSGEMVCTSFPWVRLVRNSENKGFGGAHNQVLRESESPYILVLNPDIVVSAGSVDAMIGLMANNSEVGALGCKLLNEDGSLQASCRRFPTALTILLRALGGEVLFPQAEIFRRYFMSDWDHDSVAEVDWVTGACLLLRKAALKDAGCFDEGFFMYHEDIDLCRRLWEKWKVCYYPEVCMTHYHRQRSHGLLAFRQRWIHTMSVLRFFGKHGISPRRPAKYRMADTVPNSRI